MIKKLHQLLYFCCLITSVISQAALSVEKHALVIGNAAYPNQPLSNTRNDANDISDALQGMGFNIHGGGAQLDLGLDEMEDLFYQFTANVPDGSVAMLYYAGHGYYAQKDTWLIPVDADITRERQVKRSAMALGEMMDELRAINGRGLNLLFLDACRNNPFGGGYRGGTRGLVRPARVPSGTFVGLAADQGEVAADGDGRNGLYTKYLLEAMLEHPHIEIENLHKRVARAVFRDSRQTEHPQRPVYQSNILDDFCFGGCNPVEVVTAPANPDIALLSSPSGERLGQGLAAQQQATLAKYGAAWASYIDSVERHVLQQWAKPPGLKASAWSCAVTVNQTVHGEVEHVQIDSCTVDHSGLHRAVERTVFRASPLPSASSDSLFSQVLKLNIGLENTQEAPAVSRLWVTTNPAGARVRIMNIRPKFVEGIELKSGGKYDIQVSKQGYVSWRKTVQLTESEHTIIATLEKEIIEPRLSYEPEMVNISGGRFRMGCMSSDGDCFGDELPVYEIQMKGFRLSRNEVTFAQYDAFAEATGRVKPNDEGWGREQRPVINVSWGDAQAYIEWLNEKSGKSYRLPSESEWEYAARAGTRSKYSWADTVGSNKANCMGCGSEWDNKQTAPVGSFAANGWGLHDMHGNVWEWVEDVWHDNYRRAPDDGRAWTWGDSSRRVMRGGAWSLGAQDMRAARRYWVTPSDRTDTVGFRLAENK